ncbi:MAG: purine-binding chemotaxis protein CheW [Cyanobacteria bacterium]|jgi:positive phototaxis protein PixI|uniref:chemotaxis protein CheW n=1 Tax=Geminocystis sp. TaxID=2664100 RepID=UPI001DA6E6DC|nr:purine-binding chemotaxis protein CheW [Cyanobacteria bacterium CG_2015-16_32_12]NCO79131.1 purine-binding chemotaxis protein CheW [Cyanobacteria bacterium CG_2015-22_32_23]NCQ05240.1 purine-binding chemotaxis protein CheW [Cyanobacteria bacterium CG_2015-09_32_10]NCQ42458.1 purine-binding chemotaxis protein CheW [Cyanobacteria bacterium CG_2015-04_32_10]NCS86027.1 purine-binding chemotaxis protein CheW [Cyanobacteria bacterium CG_2015-02_32_10]
MSEQILPFSSQRKNLVSERQQFLRFVLLPDTNLMISLSEIAAVLKIPFGQIIAIPEMPSWVIGVYNWRGEIVWMIDLGQLLGFTPWYQQSVVSSHHKAVVIHPSTQDRKNRSSGDLVGLIVSDVNDIEFCDTDKLHSPPASAVTPDLAPFLRGYWIKENGDIIVTIDGDAIFAAMPKE